MGHPTRTELEPSSSQSPNARHSAASWGAPAQGHCWRAGKEPPAASAQGAGLSLRTARTGRQPHGDTPCFARARKTFIKHFRGQRQKEGSLDAGIISKRAMPSLPGSLARRGSVLLRGMGGGWGEGHNGMGCGAQEGDAAGGREALRQSTGKSATGAAAGGAGGFRPLLTAQPPAAQPHGRGPTSPGPQRDSGAPQLRR